MKNRMRYLIVLFTVLLITACSTEIPSLNSQTESLTKEVPGIESTTTTTFGQSITGTVVNNEKDGIPGVKETKIIDIKDLIDLDNSVGSPAIDSFSGFSDLYKPAGYSPINGSDEILVLNPSSAGSSLGLLNIKTSDIKIIVEGEQGYSYMYSGSDNRYIIAYKYSLDINAYPVPIMYIIYDRVSGEMQNIDISDIQKASGAGYIHSYVSVFDGKIYFEIQDKGIARNDNGLVIKYGESIYSYDIAGKSLVKIRDNCSSPTVNKNGLYFKDFGTDGDSGSLYFIEASKMIDKNAISKEIVKNCGEYFIHEDKIYHTPDRDNNIVYLYNGETSEFVFSQPEGSTAWDYRTNGRYITASYEKGPIYLYDILKGYIVLLTDSPGGNFSISSDKYIIWYELENINPETSVEKGNFIPEYGLHFIEISSLID